jgi:protocatechuate 3,4-dioxygenase beta subunit
LLNKPLLAVVVTLGAGVLGALAWSLSLNAASPPADKETKAVAAKPGPVPAAEKANSPGEPAEVRGRVLDPEGKPVAGARVSYLQNKPPQEQAAFYPSAFSGAADGSGRFRLAVTMHGRSPYRAFNPIGTLTATAPGYAPAAIHVGAPEELEDFTLRLVKDDVPIEGRLIDLEGKPVAGVTVRPVHVRANLGDLGPWLDAIRDKRDLPEGAYLGINFSAAQVGLTQTATTDADGRFRLSGAGRERIVALRLDGPAVETQFLNVMTRPGKRFRVGDRRYWDLANGPDLIYPARFEHAVAPAAPLEGVVRDQDTGKPIPGAKVWCSLGVPFDWDREYVSATADADGRYRLVGRPRLSPYWVHAEAPAGQPYHAVMRLPERAAPGQPTKLDFGLKRGVFVRGRVTDKVTGRPLQAKVTYFALATNPALNGVEKYPDPPTALTQKDGSFTLVALPGPGIIAARLDDGSRGRYVLGLGADRIKGYDPKTDGFRTKPDFVWARNYDALAGIEPSADAGSITCDLQLDPGKTVTVTCVGPDGQPLRGVHVHASLGYGRSIDMHDLPTERFTLYGLNPQKPGPFFFHHHAKKLAAAVVLKGDEPEGFPVRLRPTATITGRLLDPFGTPLTGADIAGDFKGGQFNLAQGWGGFFWGKTDKDGRFRIEGIIPGVRVGAHHRHGSPSRQGDLIFDALTLQPGEVRDLGDIKIKASPN